MFFRKKEENKKRKKGTIEKVVMGAVIGGAIGSVVGAAVAPKKGKETREEIVEVVKKASITSGGVFKKIKELFVKHKKKKIPTEDK